MVGLTALLSGYLLNSLWPETFSGRFNTPLFVFVLGVSCIHGVVRAKAVNVAINITPLILFSMSAISFRVHHPNGLKGYQLVNGTPVDYVVEEEQIVEDGEPNVESNGHPPAKNKIDEKADGPLPR